MYTLKVLTLCYMNFTLIDLLKQINQKKGKEDHKEQKTEMLKKFKKYIFRFMLAIKVKLLVE